MSGGICPRVNSQPCPLFEYSDTWQLVINTGTNVLDGVPHPERASAERKVDQDGDAAVCRQRKQFAAAGCCGVSASGHFPSGPEIGCTTWAQILLKFVLSHPA